MGIFDEPKRLLGRYAKNKKIGVAVFIFIAVLSCIWWFARTDSHGGKAKNVGEVTAPISSSQGRAGTTPSSNHRAERTSMSTGGTSGLVGVPVKYQFDGVSAVQSSNSFKEWLAKFDPSQQPAIKSFAKRFPGVYEISSPEQVAWMAQKGYLMPEDVIAASGMTDQDLKQLADQGNLKAKLLYGQRVQERYNQAQDAYTAAGGQRRQVFGIT